MWTRGILCFVFLKKLEKKLTQKMAETLANAKAFV